MQVIRNVHEDFVNGIDVNVILRNIALIDVVYAVAVVHVELHSRFGDDESYLQIGIALQGNEVTGLAGKLFLIGFLSSFPVYVPYLTVDLKKARSSRQTIHLQ